MDQYLKNSIFLADVNNDRKDKDMQQARNLASLDKFVMYRFTKDKMVVPRDSSWFSFYNGSALLPLEDQALYKQDWLGLREMDEAGKLFFLDIEGEHMQFSFDWFEAEIIHGYLESAAAAVVTV